MSPTCESCGRHVSRGEMRVVARQTDLPDGLVIGQRCRSKFPASKQYHPTDWPPQDRGELL